MSHLVFAILSFVFTIAVILVIRELVCWYWKMNDTVALLKDQRGLLESIDHELKRLNGRIDEAEEDD